MPERFTDTLTYVLSVALAAAVIAFAAYKVVKLNGMEDPPANMGLNFPPLKRKVIIDQPIGGADPLTTQTLAPAQSTFQRPSMPDGGGTLAGPVRSYELLAVVDGVAFVDIELARGKTLVPVTVGTVLPGGIRIETIERRNGRWVLVAGPVQLVQAESPVQ